MSDEGCESWCPAGLQRQDSMQAPIKSGNYIKKKLKKKKVRSCALKYNLVPVNYSTPEVGILFCLI